VRDAGVELEIRRIAVQPDIHPGVELRRRRQQIGHRDIGRVGRRRVRIGAHRRIQLAEHRPLRGDAVAEVDDTNDVEVLAAVIGIFPVLGSKRHHIQG